ncbi:hypothetical protein F4801DRAFT_598887 [Xylaria longipes]|nr:hypothetical protein F4801DRAFT_598887 [Xylaria longipes]
MSPPLSTFSKLTTIPGMDQFLPGKDFNDDLDALTQMMQGVVYVGKDESHTTSITWVIHAQMIAKEFRNGTQRPPRVEWTVQSGQLKLVADGIVTSVSSVSKLMTTAINEAAELL